MSSSAKCEHGEKITTFCATECCVWKDAGGCSTCMKKYHNHMGPTLFVSEQETLKLFKKYNVDPSVKPKCRSLQEAIFNFFHIIKTQFNGLIESACSQIINSIGHPYLTVNQMLTTFKRIKKKDYKKIQQKDFRHFYDITMHLADSQLLQCQKKIYIEKVKQKMEFINGIQKIMKNLEKFDRETGGKSLAHDSSISAKINDIVKHILVVKPGSVQGSPSSPYSPKIHGNNNQNLASTGYNTTPFRLTEKLERVEVDDEEQQEKLKEKKLSEKNQQTIRNSGDYSHLLKKRDSTLVQQRQKQRQIYYEEDKNKNNTADNVSPKNISKISKQIQEQKQKRMEKQKDKERYRLNSLDKQFTKTNKLAQKHENNTSLAMNDKLREEKQTRELQKKEDISPKRKAFNSKQIQIHEKKQKLIDMLKQREDANSGGAPYVIISPAKKTSNAPFSSSGTTNTNHPKDLLLKFTQINQNSDQRSHSHGSGQSFDLSKEDSQNKLNFFAHTSLPRSQSRQKIYQQAEQVAQKTIIIPIQSVEGIRGQESPLMKNRYQSKEFKRQNLDIIESERQKEKLKEKQKQKQKEKQKLKQREKEKLIQKQKQKEKQKDKLIQKQKERQKEKEKDKQKEKEKDKQKLIQKEKQKEKQKQKQKQKQRQRMMSGNLRSKGSSITQQLQLSERQQKSIALLIKSLSLKSPQQAIPLLQKSLQFAEDNLSSAEYISYLYLEINRPKDCLNTCNKMLQKIANTSSTSELAWHLNLIINKSAALNKLGRYSESIVILEQCLKHKQHEKLFKNLADAYFSIGIFEKANYYYEKAVSMDDHYDEAHYNLAVCLFMQENYHNAKFAILKALQYNIKNQVYVELQKEINLRIKQF